MINLNEQEIELLIRELGFINETEIRSATTQMIIKRIIEKLQDNENK